MNVTHLKIRSHLTGIKELKLGYGLTGHGWVTAAPQLKGVWCHCLYLKINSDTPKTQKYHDASFDVIGSNTGFRCNNLRYHRSWWRHRMETFSALLALCAGNSPVTGEFPTQRPVTLSFFFFDLRLNKPLCKQSGGLRFETPSLPLWRHCVDEVGIMTQRAISFIVKEGLRAVNRIIFCIWWEMQPIVSDSVFFIRHLIHRWWWNHVTSPCCLLTIRDPFY